MGMCACQTGMGTVTWKSCVCVHARTHACVFVRLWPFAPARREPLLSLRACRQQCWRVDQLVKGFSKFRRPSQRLVRAPRCFAVIVTRQFLFETSVLC